VRIPVRTLPIQIEHEDQVGTPALIDVDLEAFQDDLEEHIQGEVCFDGGTRGMYAYDASNYRQVPIAVVIPETKGDIIRAVSIARKHKVPIHGRGGGTSIPGQGINAGLMIDFAKYYNQIIEIDPAEKTARVQPGLVLDELQKEARKHGLMFGPDPATHSRCTFGGMIGNNSCGPHSVLAGRTADNIESLEILLYDGTVMEVGWTSPEEWQRRIERGGREGEIFGRLKELRGKYKDEIEKRFPRIPRRVSGYNLDELLTHTRLKGDDTRPNLARALVGSEGTCAIVLEATVKLVEARPERVLVLIGFRDVVSAGKYVPEALKFKPVAVEGMDDTFIQDMEKKGMHPKNIDQLPEGKAWLYVEFGAETVDDATRQAQKLVSDVSGYPIKLVSDKVLQAGLWHLREAGLGATAKVPGENENHEGWEDTAVHPDQVGDYLADFIKLTQKYNYRGAMYGHFGDGCVHTRLDFDLDTQQGIEKYRAFVEEGADLVARYNGSISGEHGDGQARGELLRRMFGDEIIRAFVAFKEIWDPDWKMNPGKLIAPYGLDENLSRGPGFEEKLRHPRGVSPLPALSPVETYFKYRDDKGNFVEASLRCVGAGVCRRHEGGTMCPSYMVTREEKHCTRGRSRLLYEMLQGETIKDGWKSEEVKEALDLCLACKGCKGDCPVQVDMATYKAEFLAHYYKGRLRPRQAYVFGLIHVWAKLASFAPWFFNFFTQTPGLRSISKVMAGIAPQRNLPKFAGRSFKKWFSKRTANPQASTNRVVLWPDTFNNYFHPNTAQAAVEVLEHAGFNVIVPMQDMCCGRPLYDYGMLDKAKAWLLHLLEVMKEHIDAGTPIVVLEPSCASVFRDELVNLFPDNEDAKKLSKQVVLFADFLVKNNYKPPKAKGKALLHGHCHHKALWNMDSEEQLLRDSGIDFTRPDSGCCGMAGAFGFEKGEHHEVAMKCGERVLLPEVRKADKETLIIADGFSCREQVQQSTGRKAMHLAEVLDSSDGRALKQTVKQ